MLSFIVSDIIRLFLSGFFILGVFFQAAQASDSLRTVGYLVSQGQGEKAILWLEEKLAQENISGEERESFLFALATLLYERGQKEHSEKYFELLKHQKGTFDDWTNLYLGRLAVEREQWAKAKRFLKPLTYHRKPRRLHIDARMEMAKMAVARRHWRAATRELRYLERKYRNDEIHPEIVWNLIKAEKGRGRRWRTCFWARKMYSSHPTHSLVFHWGLEMRKNLFEGKKLDCTETANDRLKRVRRLIWAGAAPQAEKEIMALRKVKKGYDEDFLYARFLTQEGEVHKALKLLLHHYEGKKKNFKYLMSLAKAAAKAGENQPAVALYYQAHKINPRSRASRKALFQAAFLSYQNGDYDGATRKFDEFKRRYPGSGLSRDAMWYQAWMRYLKGNYTGAITSFDKMLKEKKRRRRWWRSFPADKLQYWLAKSYWRAGQRAKAYSQFQSLSGNHLRTYYSLLAGLRLGEFESVPRFLASQDLEENWQAEMESYYSELMDGAEPTKEKVLEEDESEELIGRDSDEEESVDELTTEDIDVALEEGEVPEEFSDYFKGSKLSHHYDRAKKFSEMGFLEKAKWELYEVERKTRDHKQLRALAYQYNLIGSYHRSAAIGENYFARERQRQGFEESKELWFYTYPQGYKREVIEMSDTFDVPKGFVWSIIRAESRFRQDARSPVGARGLMQLMPKTARRVSELIGETLPSADTLFEERVNIRLGTRYLQRLLDKFKSKIPLAAAGYNAGPHRVDRWLASFGRSDLEMDEFVEHIPYLETRNYVKKVVRNYHVYNELYEGEEKSISWMAQKVDVEPVEGSYYSENWAP